MTDGVSAVTLHNVLIGEVWLCSGQSNMQFSMKEVLDSAREVAAANLPNLRLLNVDLNFSATPCESFTGKWVTCSPATVKGFSAVGYYLGRELQQTLHVPVGVIFSGIGASAAQAYVPQPVLAAIVLVAVTGLIKLDALRHLWHFSRAEFVVSMAALLGVLGSGILRGFRS